MGMFQFLTDYWYGASADYQAKTTVRDGNPAYFYIHKYMRENNVPNDWNGTYNVPSVQRAQQLNGTYNVPNNWNGTNNVHNDWNGR